MDKFSIINQLKALYRLENRSVKLGTEEDYVERHIKQILSDSNQSWDDKAAQEYVDNLRASI